MQHRPMWVLMFWTVLALSATNHVIECIIRGSDAAEGYFPWLAAIEYIDPETKDYLDCGATIISDRWMISAAHCFWDIYREKNIFTVPENWHAQAGSINIRIDGLLPDDEEILHAGIQSTNSSPKTLWGRMKKYSFPAPNPERGNKIWHAPLKNIILHPKFHSGEYEYDIALIEMSSQIPLQGMNLSKAELLSGSNPDLWPPIDSLCTFVGWGCHELGGNTFEKARMVSLKVFPNSVCSKLFDDQADLTIGDREVCAGYHNLGVGLCMGDSGSGLIYVHDGKPVIVGIASEGSTMHPQSYPAVFTRVASFTDWILETIGGIE